MDQKNCRADCCVACSVSRDNVGLSLDKPTIASHPQLASCAPDLPLHLVFCLLRPGSGRKQRLCDAMPVCQGVGTPSLRREVCTTSIRRAVIVLSVVEAVCTPSATYRRPKVICGFGQLSSDVYGSHYRKSKERKTRTPDEEQFCLEPLS